MNRQRHRSAMLFFVSVFFVFTIGLPVIVASCPMVKTPGKTICKTCLPLSTRDNTSIGSQRNSSCCKTVIASGRNLTEFLNVETSFGGSTLTLLMLTSSQITGTVIPPLFSDNQNIHHRNISPTPLDIPILVSSLLI